MSEPTSPKPLQGKTILDFSVYLPGPYCASLLTSFGAKVIKVEPPAGDPARHFNAAFFEDLNRDKDSVVIDLKSEHGRNAALA